MLPRALVKAPTDPGYRSYGEDSWFQGGIRLGSLTELHSALIEVKRWVPLGTVYRGFSNLYTELMGRPSRNHIHDEERREAAARMLVKRQV